MREIYVYLYSYNMREHIPFHVLMSRLLEGLFEALGRCTSGMPY